MPIVDQDSMPIDTFMLEPVLTVGNPREGLFNNFYSETNPKR
jgi:hypothetical protein